MTDEGEFLGSRACTRSVVVDDLHVREDGSGRIVEAYAAVFRQQSEVMDQDGHYVEELSRNSFDKTIHLRHQPGKPSGFQVLFNHGSDIAGRPSGDLTMPIGVPIEVKTDDRGVFTATRYLDNPLADSVLRTIKDGGLRGQSFSGKFRRSLRSFPNGRGAGALPLITRHEVDMREYGPTVFPQYDGAMILGTRAEVFVNSLLALPSDKRLEWLRQFEGPGNLILDDDSPVSSPSNPHGLAGNQNRAADVRARIRQWKP